MKQYIAKGAFPNAEEEQSLFKWMSKVWFIDGS
jgi:hypothetical protein